MLIYIKREEKRIVGAKDEKRRGLLPNPPAAVGDSDVLRSVCVDVGRVLLWVGQSFFTLL